MLNVKLKDSIGKKSTKLFSMIFRTLFLFAMCYIILKPFVSLILSAFMSPSDLRDLRVEKIPIDWSLYYWKHAFNALGLKSFMNSLISAGGNSILQVTTSVLVGYGLSRFKFKGKTLLMIFVVIIMLVPFQVYNISQFLMFKNFLGIANLLNTQWSLLLLSTTCMGLKQSLYIYVVMNCFNGLPKALEEAAYIDGAGIFKTFISVMLPNTRNVIVTIFLLSFSWMWTDTQFSGRLISALDTLPIKITSPSMNIFLTQSSRDVLGTTIAQGAAVILLIIPLVILFIVCQKSFIKSIATSGMAN